MLYDYYINVEMCCCINILSYECFISSHFFYFSFFSCHIEKWFLKSVMGDIIWLSVCPCRCLYGLKLHCGVWDINWLTLPGTEKFLSVKPQIHISKALVLNIMFNWSLKIQKFKVMHCKKRKTYWIMNAFCTASR